MLLEQVGDAASRVVLEFDNLSLRVLFRDILLNCLKFVGGGLYVENEIVS